MARLTNSSRSKWKGVYSKIAYLSYFRLLRMRRKIGSPFRRARLRAIYLFLKKTKARASVITEKNLGVYSIHLGKHSQSVNLTTEHINHRLGEFTLTTNKGARIHKNNAKSKKLKNKK